MQPLTHIQKLDAVLNSLKIGGVNILNLQIRLQRLDIQVEELRRIIKKLEKDGYVEDASEGACIISFEGCVFLEQGGYEAKVLSDAANAEEQILEIARLKSVDVSSDLNQRILNRLTNRLSWATWFAFGAAMALLIWSIYSYYYPAKIQ